jgi:hypothetical protein
VPAARGQTLSVVESRDAVTREMEKHSSTRRAVERQCGHRIFGPAGQAGISPVAATTIVVEDDSDAVSPRTRSAAQLAFDGVLRLRPACGGRHAGLSPTRKLTKEILTTTAAPMGSFP